jgi:hypothetical protein
MSNNSNLANSVQTFDLRKGEDYVLEFTSVSDLNIADFTFSFAVKKSTKREDQALDIEKTLDDGITVTDETIGTLEVQLDSADTQSLVSGIYDFELWRTDTGNKKLLAFGTINLMKSIKTFT